jgi:hypothetical protein
MRQRNSRAVGAMLSHFASPVAPARKKRRCRRVARNTAMRHNVEG